MLFSNQHEKTLKNKGFLLTGRGNYTAHLGPHREVAGRESGSRARAAFIGVEGGSQGFVGLLFIGEFETQEQEFRALEEKQQVAEGIRCQNQPSSLKQEFPWEKWLGS